MKQEYIIEKDKVRNLIKFLAAYENITLTKLKIMVNQKFNKTDSLENLTNKLRNKTIKVSELLEIVDILDYDIIVRKR